MESIFLRFIPSHFHLATHGLLSIAAGIFDLTVGIVVLLNNPKSKINRAFLFLTLTTAVWVTMFGIMSLCNYRDLCFTFQAMAYIFGVSFIPSAFLFFADTWIGNNRNTFQTWFYFIWSIVTSLIMIFKTSGVVGIARYSWGWYPFFYRQQ